jgi:hypothetical protein
LQKGFFYVSIRHGAEYRTFIVAQKKEARNPPPYCTKTRKALPRLRSSVGFFIVVAYLPLDGAHSRTLRADFLATARNTYQRTEKFRGVLIATHPTFYCYHKKSPCVVTAHKSIMLNQPHETVGGCIHFTARPSLAQLLYNTKFIKSQDLISQKGVMYTAPGKNHCDTQPVSGRDRFPERGARGKALRSKGFPRLGPCVNASGKR